jgi:ADP-ribose pyrophosphatase
MRSYIPKNATLVPEQAKRVFKGVIYEVYQWQQQMFDGTYATFEMLKRPDTVKVLAEKDNTLIILDQEQPGQAAFYDLPGGRHDYDNETELDAIKREMLEETGMTFNSWKLIDVWQPFSKIESFMYLFSATDFLSQTDQQLDAGEKIKVMQFNLSELKNLLSDPKNRYLPKELLEKVNSIEELLNLPEIKN